MSLGLREVDATCTTTTTPRPSQQSGAAPVLSPDPQLGIHFSVQQVAGTACSNVATTVAASWRGLVWNTPSAGLGDAAAVSPAAAPPRETRLQCTCPQD